MENNTLLQNPAIGSTVTSEDFPVRYDLWDECRLAWESLSDMRDRRTRSRNYYRGKPEETMTDPDDTDSTVYEDDYIIEQGRIPYKMNLIGTTVRNMKGQFRSMKSQRMAYGRKRSDNDAAEMITEGLRYSGDINQVTEVDVDQFEESMISGLYGWKVGYKWNSMINREEICIGGLNPMWMFYNNDLKDRRGTDLRLIGEIHDVPLDQIIAAFARNKQQEEKIRQLYAEVVDATQYPYYTTSYGFDLHDSVDFVSAVTPDKARLIEVWKLEYGFKNFIHDRATGSYGLTQMTPEDVEELNLLREKEALENGIEPMPPATLTQRYEGTWMVYFLDPLGRVLYSGPTPYTHESHPYSLGLVTLVDGETWGMIEDIIDPQRLVNRITTAIDYMFGASSKGVLMVPEDSIPENMTADDFASEWTKFNGVIRYKAKPGVPQPQQVVQNSIPVGLFDWLNIQQQNIMNISAVNGPSLGQTPPSGTPASLYYQQVQQASINNRDYFDSFFETRRQRDLKVCKTFIQYWDDMRYLGVAGRRADGKTTITFDPARVKDFEFDIIISDSPDTPAARQLMEEYLTNLLQQNRLTFKQYLQLSSHPKADVILAVIEKTNPLLAQQQLGAAEQQALAQQLQLAAQSGDQDAIALLQQAK